MRDIGRIDASLSKIGDLWKRVPDWRLGQLFHNLERWHIQKYGRDCFYLEEDEFIEKLEEYLGTIKSV